MPTRSSHVSWMTIHVPSVPVREVSMCVFLQSDAVVSIFFAAHLVRLLFKGGYYSRVVFISLESPQASPMAG